MSIVGGRTMVEGNLEIKLPKYGQMRQQVVGTVREEKVSSKKVSGRARLKSRVAKRCVFPLFCGSGGSKSRLAKAASAEPSGRKKDQKMHVAVGRGTLPSQNVKSTTRWKHFWTCRKKCTRLWREVRCQVKMLKTHKVRRTFERWAVQKVHAAAREAK